METEEITIYEKPALHNPYLVAAFAGWPDAAQVATGAISYLVRKLDAKKFAEIGGEGFYDFASSRPIVKIEGGLVGSLRLPSNSFFYWQSHLANHDLVLLRGIEPHLRWQSYIDLILELATNLKAARIYTLGGLYDNVPHTREPKVSGVASSPHLKELLQKHQIQLIDYHGPSSLHSMLLATCRKQKLEAVSLWGHAPFYVRVETNPTVCFGLLRKLTELLEIEIDLEEVKKAGEYLQDMLGRLLTESDELRLYVQKLEEQYEVEGGRVGEVFEGADKIIKEVEEFLRQERRKGNMP